MLILLSATLHERILMRGDSVSFPMLIAVHKNILRVVANVVRELFGGVLVYRRHLWVKRLVVSFYRQHQLLELIVCTPSHRQCDYDVTDHRSYPEEVYQRPQFHSGGCKESLQRSRRHVQVGACDGQVRECGQGGGTQASQAEGSRRPV